MSSYLSHLPSGLPCSISGLSTNDLADIQKGDWFPELSHLVVKITAPNDIDANLDQNKFRDEGEKIDIFIHTALNPHTPALAILGTFLEKKDLAILAATLQGFASIGRILKKPDLDLELDLDPDHRHHVKHLKEQLTTNLDPTNDADDSVKLFKLLCEQAESGKSDLIRWNAANTLQQLEYLESLRIDLLHTSPAKIAGEILQKYISRLSDRYNPGQDREYIKFWVYGPTEILLSVCNDTYYIDYIHVVGEVLRQSGMRGIRLALQCGNATAVTQAIHFAGEIFNQIKPDSKDIRYIDNETRKKLVSLLLPYINHSDIELRNLVAEKLNDGSNEYQVSNYLLDDVNRAKVAVIDTTYSERWQRVVDLGDLSIPVLCEVVEGKLKLNNDEKRNVGCQIEALKSLNKIIKDIPKKVAILSPCLQQHCSDTLRLETFNLLKKHWAYLDDQSIKLLIEIALAIFEDWELVISYGHRGIPVLCKVIDGEFILKLDEKSNFNCQIEALKSLNEIIKDIPEKVAILSPYLQHYNDTLRLEVAKLLQPQKKDLDPLSSQILTALLFQLNLPLPPSPSTILENLENLKNHLQNVKNTKQYLNTTFSKAINACRDKSGSTKEFLKKQQNILINEIEEKINSIAKEQKDKLELIKVPYFTIAVVLICLSFEIWFIPQVVDNWLLEEININAEAEAREEVNKKIGEPKCCFLVCWTCDENSAVKEYRRLSEERQKADIKQKLLNRRKELLKEEKLEIEVPKQVNQEFGQSIKLNSTIGCILGFNVGIIAGYLSSVIISLWILNQNGNTNWITLTCASGLLIILTDIIISFILFIPSHQPSNLSKLSNTDFISWAFNRSIMYSALISFNFGFISSIDMLHSLLKITEKRFKFAITFINYSKIEFLLTLILGFSISSFMVFRNFQFLVLCFILLVFLTIRIMNRQRNVNKYHNK